MRDGPELVPLFPILAFTPSCSCPHHGPIPPGNPLVCMVCHHSGRDSDHRLRRSPLTDPKRDPKPDPPPRKLTKKDKQHIIRLYGKQLDPATRKWMSIHCR